MKISYGGFSVIIIVGREDIFKLTVMNILHETGYFNGVGVAVNFATSKKLLVKSLMLLYHSRVKSPFKALFGTGGFKHGAEENIKRK
jgi:hypothetical protein